MLTVQTSAGVSQLLPQGGRIDPLETAVHRQLAESAYPDLRGLDCHLENGILTLTGCVDSYYLKQLAQIAARRVMGEFLIDNQIQVVDR